MHTIYNRVLATSGGTHQDYYRYSRIKEGQGQRTCHLAPPFYIRLSLGGGKKKWHKLQATTFDAAKVEAALGATAVEAQRAGLTVKEAQNMTDGNRTLIATVIESYISNKPKADGTRRKKPWSDATKKAYRFVLGEFLAHLPPAVKFIDQVVQHDVLKRHLEWLESQDASPKTIENKMMAICFAMKYAGVPTPSAKFEMPHVEEEIAEPYTREDLQKLFEAMDEEERIRYEFFLVTACREKEVAHATWDDIKDGKYTVRAKSYKTRDGKSRKFSPKNHEMRSVPLTRELIDALKDRQKISKSHWIFPNEWGDPEGHFLRKFKKTAFRAGLNCGRCHTTRMEGRFEKLEVEKCCKDYAEGCEKHYLHRLRKTRATFWHDEGVPVRTIQHRLGHKSLETTQKYLGIKDDAETREIDNRRMY